MTIIIGFILIFIILFTTLNHILKQRFIIQRFEEGNVMVCGLRGRGKDMLFNWVINKRRKAYISNVKYSSKEFEGDYKKFVHIPFEADSLSLGGNSFENFINNKYQPYEYPYPDNIDYYLSDCGVYFPSQYHSILDKKYPTYAFFMALSRHLGNCNLHLNVQNLNRVWDKMREQCDNYFSCQSCHVFFHRYVRLKTIYYSNSESCIANRLPMRRKGGKYGKAIQAEYEAEYGIIKRIKFWFKLPYKYNDRIFKELLKGEQNNVQEN